MLSNNATSSSHNATRKYSLFNATSNSNSSSGLTSTSTYQDTLTNMFSGNNCKNSQSGDSNSSLFRKNFLRRNTIDMSGTFCQRCKSFEVDLTNASDNLNATDDELKASRQVISLLQRQLELVQVEKDGLEKLVVSQSKGPYQYATTSSGEIDLNEQNLIPFSDETSSCDETTFSPKDLQQKLLVLIKTQLYAKDEEIIKLKSSLKESRNQREQLDLQLHILEEDLSKLKSENQLLRENLALRDQTIVSLSNEVFEQENFSDNPISQLRRQSNVETVSSNKDFIGTQRQIAKLVDNLDAYKKTNELLSSNLIKLNDRCAKAEKKELETRSECQELEAKCCQIQSKLLSLLKEIEQTNNLNQTDKNPEVICSESVKSLIKRLLEDKSLDIPLSWKEGNRSKRVNKQDKHFNQECDELGFYISIGIDADDDNECKASKTTKSDKIRQRTRVGFLSQLAPVDESNENEEHDHRKDEEFLQKQLSIDASKSDEANWRLRWDDFIKDFDKIDLRSSKEFKNLLRAGVPQEYRCKVWKSLVNLLIGSERQLHGPDYFQSLLKPGKVQSGSKSPLNPPSKQIELDLLRTLPNNKYFESIDSVGTVRLRKVLMAYSEHNPQVGYCQGMNRLAAVALLVLPEEEAFWCLVAIIDKIMPIGYYNDLWLAQVDSNVIMDLIAIKMPNLSEHFKKQGVELSLFAWFLTIFVDGTPPALFLRLWDCFLFEGDKIMFRVALALLKMYENQLMTFDSSVAVNNFLRSAVNAPMNIDQFFEVAFNWINPLSGRLVRSKRQNHFKILRAGPQSSYSPMRLSPIHAYSRTETEDKKKIQVGSMKKSSSASDNLDQKATEDDEIPSDGNALQPMIDLSDDSPLNRSDTVDHKSLDEPPLGSMFKI